jgi:hypothetical protein
MTKKKINIGTFNLRKLIFVGLVLLLISGALVAIFWGKILYRPFNDFNGPHYLPTGYNMTNNLTNDNERIFEYSGNGTFWAGVIKNVNDEEVQEILNPFNDDPANVIRTDNNLTVNGHIVLFQVSEKHVNINKNSITQLLENIPNKNEISTENIQNISVNMAKFQVKWYCPESKLTYVVTGLVTSEQLAEMEKMTTTIVCHQKPPWNGYNIHL